MIRGGLGSRKNPSVAVGLVLGAGGVVGQAYQAGVLSALQRETGWDPRQAAIIVGTSAGSVTGAALRVGVPATDLAASLYGMPTSRRGGAILRRILPDDGEPLPTPSLGSLFRPWSLPSPALITRTLRRPLAFRPDVAAMTLVPRGRIDISARARGLDRHIGGRWPDGLRICTVRRADGARVVFGRDGAPPARPGRGRPGLLRHPRLLPTGGDRRDRVRRRRRALRHQRRRPAIGAARRRARHLLHVGGPGQRQRGGWMDPPHRAPPHGARDRPSAGGRLPGGRAWSRVPNRAVPWACAPWPRTGPPR